MFLIAAGLLAYLFSRPAGPDGGPLASYYRTYANNCTQACTGRVGEAERCAAVCDCIVAGIRDRVAQGRLADFVRQENYAAAQRLIEPALPAITRQCRETAR
jgi:hypothetical protein